MRWAMVASGCRKARAISSVVRPQIILRASAVRASRDNRGWQAVKISRSNSSPNSSSSAASGSGIACCSCSSSRISISCLRASMQRRRRSSSARRFAVAISHAPGFSGTPVTGQCSRAATSASCVRSSASVTSRIIRDRPVIRRGCSMRQTARMLRWTSAAVIAADGTFRRHASGVRAHIDLARAVHARRRKHANLAGAFPTRHMLKV